MTSKAEVSDVDRETLALLAEAAEQVHDDLADIRQAVDDIRDDINRLANNARSDQWVPIQPLTSMPLDPLASDWGARLNRFTAADVPGADGVRSRSSSAAATKAERTTVASEDAEQLIFCCEEPDLQWMGDPDFPGVGCRNCGYVVAESGSVVMASPPDVHGCELPPEPAGPVQHELF